MVSLYTNLIQILIQRLVGVEARELKVTIMEAGNLRYNSQRNPCRSFKYLTFKAGSMLNKCRTVINITTHYIDGELSRFESKGRGELADNTPSCL